MRNITTVISLALFVLASQHAFAQTSVATSLGLTGDEDSNVGAFGGVDLLFSEKNWLAGSIGVNRPTEGFEDSRSLTAALDYGHVFNAWSVSVGTALGDREGFTSKRVRGALQWQSGSVLLGAQLEENRVEATTYISGLTRIIKLEDDFSVTGIGARAAFYGVSGLALDMSYMSYDEPAGLRFRNVDLLTSRLLSAEVDRLVADGRVNPLQVQNRISQMPSRSYSNATSVLADSFALSLDYNAGGGHEFGVDFYRDTYALVDADMNTWDVRWMFPLANENNLLELWAGSSKLEGSSSAFGGLRFVFYR